MASIGPLRSQTASPIEGSFAFTESGQAGGGSVTGIGSMVFAADGTVSGSETMLVGASAAMRTTFRGTYKLESDGGGTITVTHTTAALPANDEDGSSVNSAAQTVASYRFYSTDGRTKLVAVRTDAGIHLVTTLAKM